jgi:hypothetical protein
MIVDEVQLVYECNKYGEELVVVMIVDVVQLVYECNK